MANSMTGFGRAAVLMDGRELTIELKSVNHRYLDLAFRMPRHVSFLEDEIRRMLTARLTRGHVDVFLSYRNMRDDARTAVFGFSPYSRFTCSKAPPLVSTRAKQPISTMAGATRTN